MGPPRAADILREALYRGADDVVLFTDRKTAGSDTLATSYVLKLAIERAGEFDVVFCGRQAIDGDTAQVGPQVAEKLGIPQITYAESIVSLRGREIVVERTFPTGKEKVRCTLPCLLTVLGSANMPRPRSARRLMELKLAAIPQEYPALVERWPEFGTVDAVAQHLAHRGLQIPVWTGADVGIDYSRAGLDGSPTKVLDIDYVVLESSESRDVQPDREGISALVRELVRDYAF
jgi:electron transfer flavoprotein beta subunit